ncbi:CHAT domain-containing protein [Shewanella sp. AS16]|uniref:CHAT domain-containing protein n=1 Tax=Shewanella sp. AS16 TaxID=2907625 RepID=UPI001F394A60|nr:CHAT domain-containing protein [Shewanella sp. AS16]MCE9686107.1 CHAT domain-containing protein [Shewanella sp. AS16]
MDTTSDIRSVKLELLRSGPTHNQLLSPLTNYIALCGSDGPVTLNMPFEHRQLMMRLKRLKYPLDRDPATDEQRQAEIRDLGEAVGHIFGQVPALISELGNAGATNGTLVHLSLAMSAFELGLLPFEAAVAADGFPGAGSPMFLQMRTPISLTREIRRGRPLPINWARPPRILFIFAAPAGLYVPAQAHLQALREAIEPWVKLKKDPKERIEEVKKMLTIVPNASLEQIRALSASTEFTHIHILAHGAPFKKSGDKRYGLALCSEGGDQPDIVEGERLAIALTASDSVGNTRFRPTLVTLATCDSGNINSVLTPGGSIAHELNAAGIPWVIASQFPLWMKASAIAARVLYTGLLQGSDPRWVLYELRQRLRTDAPETHDWASIVAYSTIPADFDRQVHAFRDQQTQGKIDVMFDRMDELVCSITAKKHASGSCDVAEEVQRELTRLAAAIRAELRHWREEGRDKQSAREQSRHLGLSAASEKRIGIAHTLIGARSQANLAYRACHDFYKAAWRMDPCNHWLLTQYLSIVAILNRGDDGAGLQQLSDRYGSRWSAAFEMARWEAQNCSGREKVYALSTLAELCLLNVVYHPQSADGTALKQQISDFCRQMLNEPMADNFPILSTLRQFRRYLQDWDSPLWAGLAQTALGALEGDNLLISGPTSAQSWGDARQAVNT